MKGAKREVRARIFAAVSAVIFCTVILGSLYFVSAAAKHDCSGEDCRVCELIQQCEKLLSTAGSAVKLCAVNFVALVFLTAVLLCGRAVFGRNTLISLKVELLD